MSTAKLIIAAGYKMKEQARQDMAEEDLGGGMFDEDVKDVRAFAAKVHLPQAYDADELEVLDTEIAIHEAPQPSLQKYKTGTKLYTCHLADTGSGVDVRAEMEIRAPIEQVSVTVELEWGGRRRASTNSLSRPHPQVLGYAMGHVIQYSNQSKPKGGLIKLFLGERSSDHSLFAKGEIPLPAPIHDREIVSRSLWKKLDENTFFYSQISCEHDEFPRRAGIVRMDFRRSHKLTRTGPKLTKLEVSGSLGMGGVIPRRINDSVTIPVILRSQSSLMMYFACVRPADSFDEGDGTVLGRLLFLQMHPHRHNKDLLKEKILGVIRTTNVLRSAQAKYR
jgi:hypothetical protein